MTAHKLIVALDYSTPQAATELIQQLNPDLCALKIGSALFTAAGPEFVRKVIAAGFKVFLDLKLHDIPNTVAHASAVAASLGVWMLTLHASGGKKMLQAAVESVKAYQAVNRPLLVAVTVLTSMHTAELSAIGVSQDLESQVSSLAMLAHQTGIDGVVCAAHEVPRIKSLCGQSFMTVTPGIRLDNSAFDDQSRVVTPQEAVRLGSDYLVIGRPITKARDPAAMVHEIANMLTVPF